MPLARNLTRCPACDMVVKIVRRVPHDQTPQCLVRRTHAAYQERGWTDVSFTHARMFKECGIPTEMAMGRLESVQLPPPEDSPRPHFAALGPIEERAVECPFAPLEANRAMQSIVGMKLSAFQRRNAFKAILADPDIITALDAVRRLNGDVHAYVKEVAAAWVLEHAPPRRLQWGEHTAAEQVVDDPELQEMRDSARR